MRKISERQWKQCSKELRVLLLKYFKSPAEALGFLVIEAAMLTQDHVESGNEISQEEALAVVISQAQSLQESVTRIKREDHFPI